MWWLCSVVEPFARWIGEHHAGELHTLGCLTFKNCGPNWNRVLGNFSAETTSGRRLRALAVIGFIDKLQELHVDLQMIESALMLLDGMRLTRAAVGHLADAAAPRPPVQRRDAQKRHVAGSGGSDQRASRNPVVTQRPPNSPAHEDLMERLAKGIDRSLPRPAAHVAKPARSGMFYKGRDPAAAYEAYNRAVALSAGREVGLFYNPYLGEYWVIIGDELSTASPLGEGWEGVVHFHTTSITDVVGRFRLPSVADFHDLKISSDRQGNAPLREFVEFDIPGVGRGRTEYGIDPAQPKPVYVRIHRAGKPTRELRFDDVDGFQRYWDSLKIYLQPGTPLYDDVVNGVLNRSRTPLDDVGQ
jgi:hypothetical protein